MMLQAAWKLFLHFQYAHGQNLDNICSCEVIINELRVQLD